MTYSSGPAVFAEDERSTRLIRRVIPCTAAEVLALHSVRKELIPPVPGRVILIVSGFIYKAAGPAFTIGAASFINGRYSNTGFQSAVNFPVVGILDATADSSGFTTPGTGPAACGNEANAADIAGKGIVSGTSGNVDYTGTGSPIVLVLMYYTLPLIP